MPCGHAAVRDRTIRDSVRSFSPPPHGQLGAVVARRGLSAAVRDGVRPQHEVDQQMTSNKNTHFASAIAVLFACTLASQASAARKAYDVEEVIKPKANRYTTTMLRTNPDLEMYIGMGFEPTEQAYTCKVTETESCRMSGSNLPAFHFKVKAKVDQAGSPLGYAYTTASN